MFAKWDDILTIETVPDVARGQCPLGGQGYAAAIFHYARTLALAAKAAGAAAQGFDEERARLLTLAEAELALLKVFAWLLTHMPLTMCEVVPVNAAVWKNQPKRLARV